MVLGASGLNPDTPDSVASLCTFSLTLGKGKFDITF